MSDALKSWKDGTVRQAIVGFVERAVSEVPVEERVAVFDNDGTLWCEKPLPIQADFILCRLFEMAQADSALRARQPWKAAYERDYAWLGTVLAEHYAGDETTCARCSVACSPRSPGSPSTTSRRSPRRSCGQPTTRRSAAPT